MREWIIGKLLCLHFNPRHVIPTVATGTKPTLNVGSTVRLHCFWTLMIHTGSKPVRGTGHIFGEKQYTSKFLRVYYRQIITQGKINIIFLTNLNTNMTYNIVSLEDTVWSCRTSATYFV